MWTALIGPLTGLVQNWFGNREKVQNAKATAQMARINAQASSWTDEFVILVWGLPFACAFIPGLDQYALNGFNTLAEMPEWYVPVFGTLSFATFGVNKVMKIRK